ncbi:MAG: hypothetical protein M3T55_02485 [Pseudomonadota bacterium]|nr:hypothetical protein [Pseudomonadota bacterium]
MTGAPFAHIGGTVIADHGPVALTASGGLRDFYAIEACLAEGAGVRRWAELCARRALTLAAVADAAALWRRAAGWADPAAADV